MSIRVGQPVPDIAFETYDPVAGDFAKFSLADQKKNGRWTILFFYPADFTFVCATEFEALADQFSWRIPSKCGLFGLSAIRSATHRPSGRRRMPPPSGELGGVGRPAVMGRSRSQLGISCPGVPIGVSSVALNAVPSVQRMWYATSCRLLVNASGECVP